MLGHPDRPHTRPAAAVGDAEGLVQVQVAHVGADRPGAGQAHLGVHVGSVEVDLPTGLVDRRADLADLPLEHPVRGRVGHHQTAQCLGVLAGLLAQVLLIDVAVVAAAHRHHRHARDHRRGGVGAVSTGGDQTVHPLRVAAGVVPCADGQQPCVFALAAGVGLQADFGKAGDLTEPRVEIIKKQVVAAGLVGGGERVQIGKARPGDRQHLRGGVELHGARAQRDHAVDQAVVLIDQPGGVAQERVLGGVRREHRVAEVIGVADGQRAGGLRRGRLVVAVGQRRGQPRQLVVGHGLVERHVHQATAGVAHVEARVQGPRHPRFGIVGLHTHGVEKHRVLHVVPGLSQRRRQGPGTVVDRFGDASQPLGPVVHRVKPRDHRQQHLRGADVAGRLVAADVLLAGLQRHPQRRLAPRVAREADDAPGHTPRVFLVRGQEARVRTAVAHRHTETLGAAHGDVGAPRSGSRGQAAGKKVGRRHHQRFGPVGDIGQRLQLGWVIHASVGRRRLHQHPAVVGGLSGVAVHRPHDHRHAHRLGAGLHHRDGLRVHVVSHIEARLFATRNRQAHAHRLGRGGGFVQQRRAGQRQAREVAHHGLEVQDRLHPSLGDLGLVRRVGRVPRRVLHDVAQNHRRRACAVVALADQRLDVGPVQLGVAPQPLQRSRLA